MAKLPSRKLYKGIREMTVRKWMSEIRIVFRIILARICQKRVLRRIRLRPSGQKIRVVFYAYSEEKWKCQHLYDALARSSKFDPVVAIGLSHLNAIFRDQDKAEKELKRLEGFFRNNGCQYVRVVKSFPMQFVPLQELSPDVVFIQQPWSLPKKYEPYMVSRYALPMYVPYYVPLHLVPEVDCRMPFHRFLHSYFALSAAWVDLLEDSTSDISKLTRFVPSGHPFLDSFAGKGSDVKNKVIYAPHFSFDHPGNCSLIQYGTFETTGIPMLEYAKKHPEVYWVFRPHPVLKARLLESGLMTAGEVEAYYSAWAAIGEVSTEGNYQELFKESRLLITDCSSFLAEFGATGSPVIHILSKCPIEEKCEASRMLLSSYYSVRSVEELISACGMLIEKGEDPKKIERTAAVVNAGLLGQDASENIVGYLNQLLR